MIGAARVRAVAVIIKFVPRLGDNVVDDLAGSVSVRKTLAAAGAAPARLFVTVILTRAGASIMMLYAEKIVDRSKAKIKIPIRDRLGGELLMTIISNIRNNDVKRSPR